MLDFTQLQVTGVGGIFLPGNDLNDPADDGIQINYTALDPATGVTSYDVWITNDSTFTNVPAAGIVTQVPPATQTLQNLGALAGITVEAPIYWRARATLASPLRGPWSESRTINPQPVAAVNAPAQNSPAGLTAQSVAITPVFTWAAYKNATGYELQVAVAGSAADFTADKLVVDLTGANALGNVTSYYLAEPLEYSTAYFWRVRALTAAGSSDWSGSTGFLTRDAPVEPTPPVIVEPPAPAPQIVPGYIYAIIAVGAILVIVVLVLIVRTRRPM